MIESFTVRRLFSLRTDIRKQIIIFFDTNNYNSLTYTNCAVRVQALCSACRANYNRYDNLKLFSKKGKLGLEKPTTLSFEERRTLSYLDKLTLTFFSENRKCKQTHNLFKRYSGHELWKKSGSLQQNS